MKPCMIFRQAPIKFLLSGIYLFLMISCSDIPYHVHTELPHQTGWHKDSVLTFHVTQLDTAISYDVFLEIRNTNDYAFRNIWLYYWEGPEHATSLDTLGLDLAKPNGEWLGQGLGNYHNHKAIIYSNLKANKDSTLRIHIQHGIRDHLLKGISSIGVRIEKMKDGQK